MGGGSAKDRRKLERAAKRPSAKKESSTQPSPPLDDHSVPSISPEYERKAPLNVGDSIGVAAFLFTIIFLILTPPFWLKIPLLLLSDAGIFVFAFKSHWTHSWRKLYQCAGALAITAVVALIAVPQLVSQWKTEHPMQKAPPITLPQGPDLLWGEEHSISSTFDPQRSGDVLIVCAGRIQNRSDIPSTASNWKLRVILPGDLRPRFAELLRPQKQNLSPWNGIPLMNGFNDVFTWRNYLPESTVKNPIRRGYPVVGWIAFVLKDVPNTRLVSGTTVILYFDDEMGMTSWRNMTLTEPLSEMPYIPGLIP